MSHASAHRRHPARVRLGVIALAAAALLVAAFSGHAPTGTSAAFTDTGAGTGSFQTGTATAATGVLCTNNSDGYTVTISWAYSGPQAASFDVLINSSVIVNVPPATRAVTLSAGGLLLLGINQPITVRTNYSANWTATSSLVRVNVLSLLGIAGVRCVTA